MTIFAVYSTFASERWDVVTSLDAKRVPPARRAARLHNEIVWDGIRNFFGYLWVAAENRNDRSIFITYFGSYE